MRFQRGDKVAIRRDSEVWNLGYRTGTVLRYQNVAEFIGQREAQWGTAAEKRICVPRHLRDAVWPIVACDPCPPSPMAMSVALPEHILVPLATDPAALN